VHCSSGTAPSVAEAWPGARGYGARRTPSWTRRVYVKEGEPGPEQVDALEDLYPPIALLSRSNAPAPTPDQCAPESAHGAKRRRTPSVMRAGDHRSPHLLPERPSRREGRPGERGGPTTRPLPRQPVPANGPKRSRGPPVIDAEGAQRRGGRHEESRARETNSGASEALTAVG
jgi:hypothetical protein